MPERGTAGRSVVERRLRTLIACATLASWMSAGQSTAWAAPPPDAAPASCLAHGALQICQPRVYLFAKQGGARDHLKPELQFSLRNAGTEPIVLFYPASDTGGFHFGAFPVISGRPEVKGLPGCGRALVDCLLDPNFHPLVLKPGQSQMASMSVAGDVDAQLSRRSSASGLAFAGTIAILESDRTVHRISLGFPLLRAEQNYPGDVDQQNARQKAGFFGGVFNHLLTGKPN